MYKNHSRVAVIAALLASASLSMASVSVPFTETFSANASGWIANGTNVITWNASGGPEGGTYISTTTTVDVGGFGTIIFRGNNAQNASGDAFVGDWLAAGVDLFTFSIYHNASDALNFYARLDAGMGNAASSYPISIAPNTWTTVSLAITNSYGPGGVWESYGAAGTNFTKIFTNIQNVQIALSTNQPVSAEGNTYEVGLTGVSVVPEAQTGLYLALAALLLVGVKFFPYVTGNKLYITTR